MALLAAATLILSGCDRRRDDVPVLVSVIEPVPPRPGPSPTRLVLAAAVSQGLVRFDASGGIEPGLAQRWIVRDDGRSFIFRLQEASWPGGKPIVAEDVARTLRRKLAPRARNPLRPYLTAIDEIVAMTPQVIEVRLRYPRPDLLNLFAHPAMTVPAPDRRVGSGPFRIEPDSGATVLLRPVDDGSDEEDAGTNGIAPEEFVRVRGERAAAAVWRFKEKRSDLVLGGGLSDWPLVAAAGIAPANVHVDTAAGLFGLQVVDRSGPLARADLRAAVAMAIDAEAVTTTVRGGWLPTATILPEQLDSAAPPAPAAWSTTPLAERPSTAVARVAALGEPVRLRIAMPDGPGGTLVYAQIAAGLARAGFRPERVGPAAAADLRLVDEVAPYDSARWYLRTACQPCSASVATLIGDARFAPDVASRARALALADRALADDVAFIPLARPLRWSLVALRLRVFAANARAVHPLNHLRRDTN
ncbi:peptide/nickel transport system substrate-binding protein [Sphingomonas guangdongensis]|uniref:Peptide/nickel transport system substrate-binding protein n=1 Tax=Sphingomonas guangdongensis TaxID=1141890 RepID=A0A285R0J8_9SPHN|nr:ABC transporter substrate-binding protein [Sphingomonas guangdongensis]SOB87364.1 peptide/nickel transport system substrate-binding protein [Sphingomonas guangdongensis]